MKPQQLVVAGLLAAGLAVAGWLWLAPRGQPARTLTGYVEGEALYLAAPVAGALTRIDVRRGDEVAAGQALFVVDPSQLSAQRDQAEAQLAAAQAQAMDARQGQRPVELAVFEAQIDAARAAEREAGAALSRVRPLVRQGIYARARLDDAQATYDTARANTTAAVRRRDAATLGARQEAVRAADAQVSAARANVQGASARVRDLAPAAPSAARVEEVFVQRGEWVSANQPVLSLLPRDRIKVRFYAPAASLGAYRIGRTVRFACDACRGGLTARIVYVSPRPEFTPPIIYSREARDRLVFLVEAQPAAGAALVPGQPVDVEPLP
jgi:HlyD family secretion protein